MLTIRNHLHVFMTEPSKMYSAAKISDPCAARGLGATGNSATKPLQNQIYVTTKGGIYRINQTYSVFTGMANVCNVAPTLQEQVREGETNRNIEATLKGSHLLGILEFISTHYLLLFILYCYCLCMYKCLFLLSKCVCCATVHLEFTLGLIMSCNPA